MIRWPWTEKELPPDLPEEEKEPDRSPFPPFGKPPETCPKCGVVVGWKGPTYSPHEHRATIHFSYHVWECLKWTCEECGYVLKMQPKTSDTA